jgi:hypothetical protein
MDGLGRACRSTLRSIKMIHVQRSPLDGTQHPTYLIISTLREAPGEGAHGRKDQQKLVSFQQHGCVSESRAFPVLLLPFYRF